MKTCAFCCFTITICFKCFKITFRKSTYRITELLNKFRAEYPTLNGQSKQVRDLLVAVRDKIKTSAEQDLYIPIGYAKQ